MKQAFIFIRLILIFLALGLSASGAIGAESCSSVFSSVADTVRIDGPTYPPIHLKQFYKSIGSWDKPVPFHTLNSDSLFQHLMKTGVVSGQLTSFEKGIDGGLQQIVLPEYSTSFIVVKSADNQGIMTLKDIMGRWFTVKVDTSNWKSSVKVDFKSFKFIPEEPNVFNEYSNFLRGVYARLRIESMNANQVGDYLTTIQLKTSTNADKADGEKHQQYIDGIHSANILISNILKSNRPMTVADLSEINLSANQGMNPYEFQANAPMAGVMRGAFSKKAIEKNKELTIDMSLFEVAQTWKTKGIGVQRINYFAPAKEVPQRTADLLKRINTINSQSTPMEVFELYKEFIHIHPFADGNGRTGRVLLNFLLLKANLPPSEKPAASLFYRAQDSLRKYIDNVAKESGKAAFKNGDKQAYESKSMYSVKDIQNMPEFTNYLKNTYELSSLSIDHLYGTRAYLFVAVYKGRYIQFESTHDGGLSDSLHVMISRSKEVIDMQEKEAAAAGATAPKFAVYPELLSQPRNFHLVHQEHYLTEQFREKLQKNPDPNQTANIQKIADKRYHEILAEAQKQTTDYGYIKTMMQAPQVYHQVKTVEDVADQVMTITSAAYQKKIYESMTVKSSPENRQTTVEIYNAFNSKKFEEFMITMALKALKKCRLANECSESQRSDIPEKYLAQVLKAEAEQRGIMLETISRQAGREPGRLFVQRIRRGSLIIDDGAPGNHGLMPHALQNLFIYEQVGFERAQKFFSELTGWTYERIFDSNNAFTPIPSTRDITRKHYWTGIIKSGNRAESSKLGSLKAEEGKYPDFIRKNGLELVEVREIEKSMVNDGSIVKARYQGQTFEFQIDRDGVPVSGVQEMVDQIKNQIQKAG
ncbi:Fic family protein [Bdellovibrio sp. HCB290]|uniref:Fic family protein n=1 Tax=Bdellovibrio sp. HCB290 TaxID=3394356 RepID=UPI0039B37B95